MKILVAINFLFLFLYTILYAHLFIAAFFLLFPLKNILKYFSLWCLKRLFLSFFIQKANLSKAHTFA